MWVSPIWVCNSPSGWVFERLQTFEGMNFQSLSEAEEEWGPKIVKLEL
jgi:hypothetical protein